MTFLSIRNKILASLVVMTLFFGFGMILFAKTTVYHKLHDKLLDKGVVLTKRVAADCVNPVITERYFEITMFLKDLMVSENDVVYAYVLNEDGRNVAHTFAHEVPLELILAHRADLQQSFSTKNLSTDKGSVQDIAVPLLQGQIGVLHLGFSEEAIENDVSDIVKAIVLFSVGMLLLGITTALVFSRAITKPLLMLAGAAEAFGRGELRTQVVVDSDDEVGELAGIFNSMIENRQQAEEKLRESEEKHRLLFDSAGDPIFIHDQEGRMLAVNQQAMKQYGYTHSEIMALPIDRIDTPAESQYTPQRIASLMEQGHLIFETVHQRKDGSLIQVEVNAQRIIWDGKQAMMSICRDITERHHAEEKLRRSEKRFSGIMNQISDAIFISDMNGNLIDVNRQACVSLGYRREELLQLTVAEVDPTFLDDNHSRDIWGKLSADSTVTIESRHQRKDGSTFPVENHIGKIELEEKFAILGVARDISERKQAEEYIRNILDTVDEGFIVVDRDYRIKTANKAYCDQIGLPCEEVMGRHCYDVSHQLEMPCFDAGEECAVRQVFASGNPHTVVHSHLDRDGEILYVETKAFPNKDEAGNVVSAIEVIHNITERHLLEAEQLKTQKLEAIGTLAGGIAHDFNNLLQGVFGYVSMAKLASNRPERVKEMLDQAEKALSLSVNLTTQLLTFAKGGKPVKKCVDLKPVIENAANFALSGSQCDCRLKLAPDLWSVEVDAGQISQVIQNIVLNASEAMPGGGTVELSARNNDTREGGRQIWIEIKDSGVGIPETCLPKIFDPYFTTKQKGSGLGLATSYSIVKNHGGSLEVASKKNKGSEFFLSLPACEPEALQEEPLLEATDALQRKRRILLMDDETMIREVAKSMIESLGHGIELARHGEEAIGKYQKALESGDPFDLVILDLTIKGGMGGQETIKKLTEIDPNVMAVVSSGYSDNPVVSECQKYGFRGWLNKPYSIEELRRCLKKFVK